MNKNKITFLLVFLLMFCTAHLYAWSTVGHRIIAEIAERNLNRKAKKELKILLEGRSLAYWSTWADQIKSDTTGTWKDTFKWHYINFPSGLSFEEFSQQLENYATENIYSAIKENQKKLKDTSLSINERRTALHFLIHLMGDLEQPLHVGRAEDMGGNKIEISWTFTNANLHYVWDSQLINYYKYSYTEYASVLDIHSKKENKKLAEGNLEDWLFDSYLLAEKIYNEIEQYDKQENQYAYYNKEVLEDQLLKGGLRLAKVLNELLG
ncbi:MAG: S1/P1 nuclease [Flavobacteriaceae bacterium]|jgi:hypothetical protein|nr:S1/P1 nuclease [Flavobacteriaceae bacterium]